MHLLPSKGSYTCSMKVQLTNKWCFVCLYSIVRLLAFNGNMINTLVKILYRCKSFFTHMLRMMLSRVDLPQVCLAWEKLRKTN